MTNQKIANEIADLLTPNLQKPKIYSFDEVREIVNYARKEQVPYDISEWKNEGEKRQYFKFFENKTKRALETIEKIASVNNENENNKVLNDIYKIAHAFSGTCENQHKDWITLEKEIREKLKNY